MSTLYSIGQMNQLGDALERADFERGDVMKLQSSLLLPDMKNALHGFAQIVRANSIDLDVEPYVRHDWSIEEHVKNGKFEWDPSKVELYYYRHWNNWSNWKSGMRSPTGHELREELKDKICYNGRLLDFLLAYPELIPSDWDKVFFWGTIYRDRQDKLLVRCLKKEDNGKSRYWRWSFELLDYRDFTGPAAIAASS